jgi:hypothetical protein
LIRPFDPSPTCRLSAAIVLLLVLPVDLFVACAGSVPVGLTLHATGKSSNSHRSGSVKKRAPGALVIGCWSAPQNLDREYFSWLAEMNFTHTLYWRSPEIRPEQWRKDLDSAANSGITLIFDSWQPAAIPEPWLHSVLSTACSAPAFGGVYAPDEPGYRYSRETKDRVPSPQRLQSAYQEIRQCGRGALFLVDAFSAEEYWVRRFVPFSGVFGLDVYPFKAGVDWAEKTRQATHRAVKLAGSRPVWMVLQGHGRADWYQYATHRLNLELPVETAPRPTPDVLEGMARAALNSGAQGIWWWSFELYDWKNPEHRKFILQFKDVNRRLKN